MFRAVNRHGQIAPTRLSDRAVARVVQRTAATAGLGHLDLAGHSLRAGFATSAAAAGKSERAIMKQTGHLPARGPQVHPRRQPLPRQRHRRTHPVTLAGWLPFSASRRRSWTPVADTPHLG